MSWKSIPILPPQRGIGFDSNILRELSRKSRIQAGSPFISEIAETSWGLSPRSALNTACDGVMKSYLLISPTADSSAADIKSVAIILSYSKSGQLPANPVISRILNYLNNARGNFPVGCRHLFLNRRILRMPRPHFVIAFRVQLARQFNAARLDNSSAQHHVGKVRHIVFQQAVVVRDDENSHIRTTNLGDALACQLHRVDVQTAVRFVEDGKLRPQHGELQNLGPLHLAPGKSVVHI